MIIPYDAISADALESLIQDLATREGTDYGESELPVHKKVEELHSLLVKGELLISYDEKTQSCGLISREEFNSR